MAATPGTSRTSRSSHQHLPLTPAVTTVRRGSHRPATASAAAAPSPVAPRPVAGVQLLSSARGVRLSRGI